MAAVASRTRTRGTGRTSTGPWAHVDFVLVVAVVLISALGTLMVYSATRRRLEAEGRVDPEYFLNRQLVFVVLGIAVMIGMTLVDYRVFRDRAALIYPATVALLFAVLTPLGSSSKGSQAWFQLASFQFQPSEWAKIALIVCLAAYASLHRGDLDAQRLAVVVGLTAVPVGLIMLQPDLGTALVFLAILLGMLLVAGARPQHLGALALMGVAVVVVVLQLGILQDYQRERLTAFLDPTEDTQRSAYNLNQSKIAIAHGGLTGTGLFNGSQTNLSYVPEQHTDFIFTVVGEELGLAGSGLLLALFAVVIWRTWRAAALARDLSGTLVCVGVLAMFVFQIFENVGMTMGIMPITGIPLPFMSYGGSATLAGFAAVGLVLNVHMRRFS
ncbi:MAG TPA: rod shape-determining protein RodA [Acidimicrobiales bacterium]|nr:rod shape-determining protein RodA [Acidimicrobiales bacterium]